MTVRPKIDIVVLLLLSLAVACSGERSYEQGTHLRYFPESNVYFDEDNKVYLLFDTVAQQWEREAQLNENQLVRLGHSVAIAQPSTPVYRDNAQHRLMYGTARYTDPAVLARKRVEDSLASLPPRAALPPTSAEEPKKKTRVGRWLQKVFGKKDKQQ
ncbi:MAG: hypothetical protein EOO08_04855 [Chitinophagaceae bacterium]|nr:MAG: hypothetical protein EOO08_04855 [Chitinophagaceae bacterium]